jgi:hypothetical protein
MLLNKRDMTVAKGRNSSLRTLLHAGDVLLRKDKEEILGNKINK